MKNEASTNPAGAVVGYLDTINDGQALGWAYAPASPSKNLTVTIYHGDRIVGQGVADIYREDLSAAGIGNGNHSFKIPLSYELANGEEHEISARVFGTNFELNGSPKTATAYVLKFDFNLIPRDQGRLELQRISADLRTSGKLNNIGNLHKVFELASMLQETMKLKEAAFAWDALKKPVGNQALFICKQAEIFLLSGQYDRALERYLQAGAVDITNAWALIGAIDCHYLLQNYSESLSTATAALELHPQNLVIRGQLDKLKKLLTLPDPAENIFVQRFSHLSALRSTAIAPRDIASDHSISKSACQQKSNDTMQPLTLNNALSKIKEVQECLDKLHQLRARASHR